MAPTSDRANLLLVAWLFPPHASVGSRRPWRLARHLPSLGWNVTVLTQASVPSRFVDPTPDALPEGVRVVRAYDPPWLARVVAALDDRRSPGKNEQKTNTEALVDSTTSPGVIDRWLPTEPAIVWAAHAAARAISIAKDIRADAILTTSYPFSAHLVGAAVSKALSISWVADLRDPWTLHFSHERKSAPTRAVERALERSTFRNADAVTVTTESLRDAYRARFADRAKDIHAVRNAFDPVSLPPPSRSSGPARLVHFGHVYGGARSLAPVLRALAALQRERQLDASRVVLENYGRFSRDDLELARSLGVDGLLSLRAPMPYNEGIASLRGASLLLLPAWESAFGPLFLPAKLYDYLLVGAPVLAMGDNAELAKIIADADAGVCVRSDEHAKITDTIRRAIDGDPTLTGATEERAKAFDARSMAERFDEVLRGARARMWHTRG